jgi:hypothetical protein
VLVDAAAVVAAEVGGVIRDQGDGIPARALADELTDQGILVAGAGLLERLVRTDGPRGELSV